jgi:hypothetical protein
MSGSVSTTQVLFKKTHDSLKDSGFTQNYSGFSQEDSGFGQRDPRFTNMIQSSGLRIQAKRLGFWSNRLMIESIMNQ